MNRGCWIQFVEQGVGLVYYIFGLWNRIWANLNSGFMHHPNSPVPLNRHKLFSKCETLFCLVIQIMCSHVYIPSISDMLWQVPFSVGLLSLRIIVRKSTHYAAMDMMTLISWLSYISLYVSATTSLTIFLFRGYLSCTVVEVFVNTAVLNFGLAVSCWFLVFPSYRTMRRSALGSVALFFRCFRKHHTLLQSGCWQFTSHPSA